MDNTYVYEKQNLKTGEVTQIEKRFTDAEMHNIREIAIELDDTMDSIISLILEEGLSVMTEEACQKVKDTYFSIYVIDE